MGADRKPVTDAERARIVAMRAERLTIEVIAARTGYARSTVKRVLGDVRTGVRREGGARLFGRRAP